MPERKLRTGQLLLCQAEKEVRLILARISAPHQLVTARAVVEVNPRIMSGCDLFRADARRHVEKLIELDVVVAERARDRCPAGKILIDEWPNDLLLEALLEIDDVVGNPELLRYRTRIVDVIERTAPACRGFGLQISAAAADSTAAS